MSLKMPDYMIFSALLLALLVFYPLTASAAPCESLTSLSLPNATITLAQNVAPGQFSPPAGTRAGIQGVACL